MLAGAGSIRSAQISRTRQDISSAIRPRTQVARGNCVCQPKMFAAAYDGLAPPKVRPSATQLGGNQFLSGESASQLRRQASSRSAAAVRQQGPRQRQHGGLTLASADGQQQRFLDVTLWAGDSIVLLLTQLSSERLPMANQGLVSILLLTIWTAVAGAKRDYEYDPSSYDSWSVAGPVAHAVQSAAFTWVLFAPMAAAAYSTLLSQHLLADPANVLLHRAPGSGLLWLVAPADGGAPEMEVIIAALFCVSAWRGLYSAYRAWSNFM